MSQAAWPGSELHPNAERLKQADKRTVTLTRFRGHARFRSGQTLIWQMNDKHLYAGRRLFSTQQVGFGDCESLLGRHQYFPLHKMASTKYISAADIMTYINMSMGFAPATVNFLLANRDVPEKTAQEMFGADWRERLNPYLANVATGENSENTVSVVTASMWAVAGQYLDTESGIVRVHQLPWQHDPARAELAKSFDRKRYPIVFEWGRTAQDLPGEATSLPSLLSALNYQEVMAMGGALEDAYVMFHSFDRVNTALYNRYFPGTIFPSGWTDVNDALFLVPLSQAMKRFPPRAASGRIRDLIESSVDAQGNRHLDDTTAMNFLLAVALPQFTLLDVNASGVRSIRPLAIQDYSIVRDIRIADAIYRVGFSLKEPNGLSLRTNVSNHMPPLPMWNAGEYVDLADSASTAREFIERNAIEISNLDREAAKDDPQYVSRILLSVLAHYAEFSRLTPGLDLNFMKNRGVRFGVTTFDSELAAELRALSPESERTFSATQPRPLRDQSDWIFRGSYATQHTLFFNMDQLLALRARHPQLKLFDLTQNIWARNLLLTDPEPL